MTKDIETLFVSLFITTIISGLISLYIHGVWMESHGLDHSAWTLFVITWSAYLLLVSFTAFLSVFNFTKNLLELAKARTPTSVDVYPKSTDDVTMDNMQEKWTHLAAKYISLSSYALMSTLLMMLVIFLGPYHHNVHMGIFWGIDVGVNVICLYLQNSFASGYYEKCCINFDFCCNRVLSKNMKDSIRKIKRDSFHKKQLNRKAQFELKVKTWPSPILSDTDSKENGAAMMSVDIKDM